jgi:hypothetical protein
MRFSSKSFPKKEALTAHYLNERLAAEADCKYTLASAVFPKSMRQARDFKGSFRNLLWLLICLGLLGADGVRNHLSQLLAPLVSAF